MKPVASLYFIKCWIFNNWTFLSFHFPAYTTNPQMITWWNESIGPCCEAQALMCFHSQRSWPVYRVSSFWTIKLRCHKQRRTHGESRSVWPQKQIPKKGLSHHDPMRNVWLAAAPDIEHLKYNVFKWQLQIVINGVTHSHTQAQLFRFRDPSCANLSHFSCLPANP